MRQLKYLPLTTTKKRNSPLSKTNQNGTTVLVKNKFTRLANIEETQKL